ncbi:lipoprotein [Geomonas silvestris]|uniref:Lipoprotein n=1 Tax=Geomonas silvestris TaxID=2740184 RepID=A0A6V8MMC5_9BACT|nr:GNA1162 family protein [Geomonas silvestris]GFO61017.1 lipoprotein [Geomonas silvestris]
MRHLIALVLVAGVLSGCVPKKITKAEAFPNMYQNMPVTVLVLPPINNTTAADASDCLTTTLTPALGAVGFYSYPAMAISDILKSEGISSSEMLLNVPPSKFKQYFGADGVMYITIDQWDTSYYVIGGHVTVGITYVLKSTTSGETLWQYRNVLQVSTAGQNSGGGIAGLIVQAVATAVKTAMQDYVPVANQLNFISLNTVPFGKYHPEHGKDQGALVVFEKNAKFDEKAAAKK